MTAHYAANLAKLQGSKVATLKPGADEGDICNRDGCTGRLELTESKDCSCHISPPCNSCLDIHSHCPVCGWEGEVP